MLDRGERGCRLNGHLTSTHSDATGKPIDSPAIPDSTATRQGTFHLGDTFANFGCTKDQIIKLF